MSAELFEYIHAVKPSLSDEKRAKLGLLLMHYITLARVSGGRVRMENILTASGKSFTSKVLGSMPLVRALAFALKIDMTCKRDDSPIPEGLRRLCERHYIDVEACKGRHKKLENARSEMWDLVIFVRVALAVMHLCLDEIEAYDFRRRVRRRDNNGVIILIQNDTASDPVLIARTRVNTAGGVLCNTDTETYLNK
ncbi:hypothetical protein RSAG8_05649, partial [Rhizoctonia solani AG-8 WAC10335]